MTCPASDKPLPHSHVGTLKTSCAHTPCKACRDHIIDEYKAKLNDEGLGEEEPWKWPDDLQKILDKFWKADWWKKRYGQTIPKSVK